MALNLILPSVAFSDSFSSWSKKVRLWWFGWELRTIPGHGPDAGMAQISHYWETNSTFGVFLDSLKVMLTKLQSVISYWNSLLLFFVFAFVCKFLLFWRILTHPWFGMLLPFNICWHTAASTMSSLIFVKKDALTEREPASCLPSLTSGIAAATAQLDAAAATSPGSHINNWLAVQMGCSLPNWLNPTHCLCAVD